jgi:hypothetical protein
MARDIFKRERTVWSNYCCSALQVHAKVELLEELRSTGVVKGNVGEAHDIGSYAAIRERELENVFRISIHHLNLSEPIDCF